MGLLSDIKEDAAGNRTMIQSSEERHIQNVLNSLHYLDKDIEKELVFLRSVMTRGQESSERKGLHASAVIVSDDKFCYRQQVLSLFYKMAQGEQVPIGLKRIFTEGDAIHEKWQRLMIRGKLTEPLECDYSLFDKRYDLSYTPDIRRAVIDDKEYVIEIKSVNSMQFKRMVKEHKAHSSGEKQLQLYMYLTGIHNGFVLCEDKNTQEIKVDVYEYDESKIKKYIKRLEKIQLYKRRLERKNKLVKRHKKCTDYNCKMAEQCPMRETCYGKKKERLV